MQKTTTNENREEYAFGYGAAQVEMFQRRRNIDTCGDFVKPYLREGMRVLDCGCGPGTITVGIADMVAPGQVIGIDINAEQLDIARKNQGDKRPNLTFQQADVMRLPFADNSFDVVFEHAMLNHFADPLAAINEQVRVLKPGGILASSNGCREAFIFPENKILTEAFDLYIQPVRDGGGDINAGFKLGELFNKAGLKNIRHTLSANNWQIEEVSAYMIRALKTNAYNQRLLKDGKITQDKLQAYAQAWDDFGKVNGACFCFLWGRAVGFKA